MISCFYLGVFEGLTEEMSWCAQFSSRAGRLL